MVIGNDVIDTPSAYIVDEVNVNETEFPTVSHDNLEEQSSPCNQALDMYVVNDWDPIDQLHIINDEAHSLYSFLDGSNFEIVQNFVSKEELKNKLFEVAINNYWEMKIVKFDKSLYVVNVLMMIASGDCGQLRYQCQSCFPSERISTIILTT